MTQEIIKYRGYSVHIDVCLVGGGAQSTFFRQALNVASADRLRRIIADLEATPRLDPSYHARRVAKLKNRLAHLEKVNAELARVTTWNS